MRRGSIIPAIRALQPPPYYYDGIHLDFRYGAGALGCYVKAAGAAPTIAPLTTLFTFTGGNQSMYMGPAGLLVASVTNKPRIEYDANGNCLGLLMEASRTNLWLQSPSFDNASWTKLRSSVSADSAVAPDGTTTAESLIEDSSVATTHLVRQDLNVTSGTTYTATFFAKANQRTQVSMQFGSENACFAFEAGIFTLSGSGTAATLSGSPTAVTIQALPNGWYRCRVSATAAATNLAGLRIFLADGGSTSYTGDGTSGLYIWGAQFEAGAFPSSYIPTAGSSVARTADSCIRTLGSEFSATAGTVVVAGRASGGQDAAADQFVYIFDDDTTNERLRFIRLISADTGRFQVSDGGATQAFLDATLTNLTAFRAAQAWAANDFAYSLDGAAVLTDATGTLPTVTILRLGLGVGGVSQMNGHITQFDYYPTRLPNGFLTTA